MAIFDQRRPGQEHLGAFLDHHDVIGHARHVRAAGRRVAEHQRDGRDARRRQPGQIAEHLPAGMKISFCVGRSAPPDSTRETTGSRFSIAIWLARRIFLSVHGLLGAALDGRIVRDDQALDTLDGTDAAERRWRPR